jgi:hypothetical protein
VLYQLSYTPNHAASADRPDGCPAPRPATPH